MVFTMPSSNGVSGDVYKRQAILGTESTEQALSSAKAEIDALLAG